MSRGILYHADREKVRVGQTIAGVAARRVPEESPGSIGQGAR